MFDYKITAINCSCASLVLLILPFRSNRLGLSFQISKCVNLSVFSVIAHLFRLTATLKIFLIAAVLVKLVDRKMIFGSIFRDIFSRILDLVVLY